MRVKFRFTFDNNSKRITQVFFVSASGDLELVTQVSGWLGIDIDSIGQDAIEKVATKVATENDDTKYIE